MHSNIIKVAAKSNRKLVGYLDATGGVIRPPKPDSKVIYYYALVLPVRTHDDDPTDPVAITELISESHNFETIGIWLRSFKLFLEQDIKKWPIFETIVSDFSFPQINGVLEAFNGVNIVNYLKYCHTFICHQQNTVFRYTKVQLCCSHLMKNIMRDVDNSFPISSKQRVYMKEIISSFFIIDSYNEIKTIFGQLSILLLTKYVSQVTVMALTKILEIVKSRGLIENNSEAIEANSTEKDEEDTQLLLNLYMSRVLFIMTLIT